MLPPGSLFSVGPSACLSLCAGSDPPAGRRVAGQHGAEGAAGGPGRGGPPGGGHPQGGGGGLPPGGAGLLRWRGRRGAAGRAAPAGNLGPHCPGAGHRQVPALQRGGVPVPVHRGLPPGQRGAAAGARVCEGVRGRGATERSAGVRPV